MFICGTENNPEDHHQVSRYRLYKAATMLYKNKDEIEQKMYSTTNSLFSQKSKIVIYDLTNMYFEGQMLGSKKARFGRSKQKRNDRRLIGLALAIDSLGFVRYSKIYKGNIGEPETFANMLDDVASQLYPAKEKPIVVMDAGISTEENLEYIRQREYDYVCVSRSKPTQYNKISEQATKLSDNRGNTIEVTKVLVPEKKDIFLHIKSHQKQLKEESMNNYSWTTIVRKMQSQQYSVQSANRKQGGKIYTSLCTKPSPDLKKIYAALNFKERPFVRKSKVVTQQ